MLCERYRDPLIQLKRILMQVFLMLPLLQRSFLIFFFFVLLALLASVYKVQPNNSSSHSRCFVQKERQRSTKLNSLVSSASKRKSPHKNGKYVFKYLIANTLFTCWIYAVSVAVSVCLISSLTFDMVHLAWLTCSTLEGAFPKLDFLLCAVNYQGSRSDSLSSLTLLKLVLQSPSVGVRPFLRLLRGIILVVLGKGLVGVESDCAVFLGWKVVNRCTRRFTP